MSDTEYDQWEPLFETGSTDKLFETNSNISVNGKSDVNVVKGEQLGEPIEINRVNLHGQTKDESSVGSSDSKIDLPKRSMELSIDTKTISSINSDRGSKEFFTDSEPILQSPSFFNSVVSTFRKETDSTLLSPSNSIRSNDLDYVISDNYILSDSTEKDKDSVGRSPSIISHRRQTSISSRRKLSKNRNLSNDLMLKSPLVKQAQPIEVQTVLQNDSSLENLDQKKHETESIETNSASNINTTTTTATTIAEDNKKEIVNDNLKENDISSVSSIASNTEAEIDNTAEKYDHKRFSEDTFSDTGYHYANKERNTEFYNIFQNELGSNDNILIDDFSCGWSADFLYQGRLYITDKNLCFNSNILGWIQQKIIPLKDIRYLEKTSAVLLPNAILIETNSEKFKFNNFISREKSFNLIKAIWSRNLLNANLEEEEREAIANKEKQLVDGNIDNQIEKTKDEKRSANTSTNGICYKFKPSSKYVNEPPFNHLETDYPHELDDPNEFVLEDLQLDGTPLEIFQIIFGEKIHSFLFDYLGSIDCDNIETPTAFQDDDEEETANKNKGSINAGDNDNIQVKSRTYSYDKNITIPGGPKSTDCHAKEQIINYDINNYIKVINITKTPNVPSGNTFATVTKYLFKWGPENNCQLQISYWIHWTGSSWIKKIIEKNVKKGQIESMIKFKSNLINYIDDNIINVENDMNINKINQENEKMEIFSANNKSKNDKINRIKDFENKESVNQFKLIIIILIFIILILLLIDIQYQKNNREYIKRIEKILTDEYLSINR